MREITLEELLEAGCHFGHQVTRSNPKAREFIFEARDNIHIIDLTITKEWLDEAAAFVRDLAQKAGSTMVVVGTKRQAHDIVETQVKRASEEVKMPAEKGNLTFITERWIGGLLTNFSEVSKNLKKLNDIEELLSGESEVQYTKKELGLFDKEKQKLVRLYGGIREITRTPDALFIIDSHLEDLAVREANRTNVKSVAIVDTNADPAVVDYPIPANDDAVGSIELIVKHIIDAWIEGKNSIKVEEEKKEGETSPKKETPSIEKKEVKKPKAAPKKEIVKKPVKKAVVKKKSSKS